MKSNTKIFGVALIATVVSIAINLVLIMIMPKPDPSLWVGAQSLIVTMASGAYSLKAKINSLIGREVDLLGVFGVALGIAAAVTPMCINREFIVPDGYIYIGITILGMLLLYIDYKNNRNAICRKIKSESISTFTETNTEIMITTILKK
jgi:hypothetical protein